MRVKFEIGQVVATPGALATFDAAFLQACLKRHTEGDWGDLDEPDQALNDWSLPNNARLLSVYQRAEDKLYIITEADRSVTTLLLPEEY